MVDENGSPETIVEKPTDGEAVVKEKAKEIEEAGK